VAKKSITIDEVKQRLVGMESQLTKDLQAFEKETGVRINYINVKRKRPKMKKGQDYPSYDEERRQPILTTKFEPELDLVYDSPEVTSG
jgi:hypothetical protein